MKIEVYTDGSCKPTNPGPAGFGFVVLFDGEIYSSGGNFLGHGTNNIAEVMGIQHTLEMLKSLDYLDSDITVYTDSQYAVGLFTKNWKPKANIALIRKTKSLVGDFSDLKIVWVRGHDGNKYNELADELARNSIDAALIL